MIASISQMLQNFHIEHYQLKSIEDRIALDRELFKSDAISQLWDHAFSIAFRNGPGHSPISNAAQRTASAESIMRFMNSALKRPGHIAVANGMEYAEFAETIKGNFSTHVPRWNQSVVPSISPRYFGGEGRIEKSLNGRNHVLIAFGTVNNADQDESFVAEILAALIGSNTSSIQYGAHLSHLPAIQEFLVNNPNVNMVAKIQRQIDVGLLGVEISAPMDHDLKPAIETLCQALKGISTGQMASEALTLAKSRAAFSFANPLDSRLGVSTQIAQHALAYDEPANPRSYIEAIKGLSSNDFKTIAHKILARKPVYVAIGDLRAIPHADEISF